MNEHFKASIRFACLKLALKYFSNANFNRSILLAGAFYDFVVENKREWEGNGDNKEGSDAH